MRIRIKLVVAVIFFTLLNGPIYATTADTIAVDTTSASVKLMASVSTETKEMSKYFSPSKILLSIIILVLTYLALRIISVLFSVWAERTTKHRITIKGLVPIIRILAWLASLSFILVAVFRPPLASILAFSASIGVAIGFAAQDLVKNIFGGISIITDKPFQVGDKIQIGDHYGEVITIGLRSTRLTTPDDSMVSVPNAEVMSHAVSNANSGEENCQVVTEIFLPLSADLHRIRQSAIETAQVSRYIFLNKPVSVLFFQENIGHKIMLKVKVKAYVNDIRNEFAFKSEITEILTNEFLDYYRDDHSKKIEII